MTEWNELGISLSNLKNNENPSSFRYKKYFTKKIKKMDFFDNVGNNNLNES